MADEQQTKAPNVIAYPPPRAAARQVLVSQMTRSELRDTIAIGILLGYMLVGMVSGVVLVAMLVLR